MAISKPRHASVHKHKRRVDLQVLPGRCSCRPGQRTSRSPVPYPGRAPPLSPASLASDSPRRIRACYLRCSPVILAQLLESCAAEVPSSERLALRLWKCASVGPLLGTPASKRPQPLHDRRMPAAPRQLALCAPEQHGPGKDVLLDRRADGPLYLPEAISPSALVLGARPSVRARAPSTARERPARRALSSSVSPLPLALRRPRCRRRLARQLQHARVGFVGGAASLVIHPPCNSLSRLALS
eukprot:scaffold1603_cov415-Prasinococcus_capsulatus_cf.AAC.5